MSADAVRPLRLVALMCTAEVLSMSGFSAYPALLPALRDSWSLSGTQAGFVGGAFFLGYMLAVSFLSSLTDRVDARSVFAGSCAIAAAGSAGFGLLAHGALTGALFQAVTGAGLAGTYMPGLKTLTDRVAGPSLPRTVAFYTSSFGIGTSASLALVGWLAAALAWRHVFLALAFGPLLALALVVLTVPRHRPDRNVRSGRWPRLHGVLAIPEVRRYVLGYAAHCWELFGLRSWLVAFIAFAASMSGSTCPWLNATDVAALINLLGIPASVLGNEAAGRTGRLRWIATAMACAGALSWLLGAATLAPWWVVLPLLAVYFVCVMSDSAALTTGLVAAAPPTQRGAAMAVYSLFGFGAGFLAPMLFGATLDAAGGGPFGWALACATLSAGGLVWAYHSRRLRVTPSSTAK